MNMHPPPPQEENHSSFVNDNHCVKSVQIRSFFWPVFSHIFPVFSLNMGKYGPEKTPYSDTFHAVDNMSN